MGDGSRQGFFFIVGGDKNKNKICLIVDVGGGKNKNKKVDQKQYDF